MGGRRVGGMKERERKSVVDLCERNWMKLIVGNV